MRTKKGYVLRPLGKEYILVAEGLEVADANQMISMIEAAALLWKAVEGKDFDAMVLAQLIVDEYGINLETAEKDVKALLQTWEKASLVEE